MASLALQETHLSNIPLLFRGKVRDVYDLGDEILLVASDRISAFDHILATPIPEKGALLSEISRFWMKKFSNLIPNHLSKKTLDDLDLSAEEKNQLAGRSEIAIKTQPLPVELIVRGYLAGSGFNEYLKTGSVCGISLPAGLAQAQNLPEPIFTPSTKAEQGQHDENISFQKMIDLVGSETAEKAKEICLKIYSLASEHAKSRGIIIADTKFEMGLHNGKLILIDEVLTPDSSRFWPVSGYQTGISPPSFDKQLVRDYLLSTDWDKNSPPPPLPEDIVTKTAAKYREAVKVLTT